MRIQFSRARNVFEPSPPQPTSLRERPVKDSPHNVYQVERTLYHPYAEKNGARTLSDRRDKEIHSIAKPQRVGLTLGTRRLYKNKKIRKEIRKKNSDSRQDARLGDRGIEGLPLKISRALSLKESGKTVEYTPNLCRSRKNMRNRSIRWKRRKGNGRRNEHTLSLGRALEGIIFSEISQ